jgi:hypothetical protein
MHPVAIRYTEYGIPALNGCVYLLRICYLAADVISLFVSRMLPNNGTTPYNMLHPFLLLHVVSLSIFLNYS